MNREFPSSIAGTFWLLNMMGSTLNIAVLLGVVIVLGMLVDDAVVVVEALYYRLQRGQQAVAAALDSLAEVGRPVTSAVFTTISAFFPLILLPGIIGDFMKVVPTVVTIGLLVSLVEAFWILPSHVISVSGRTKSVGDHLKDWRSRWTHKVRVRYTRLLARVFRRPAPFFERGRPLHWCIWRTQSLRFHGPGLSCPARQNPAPHPNLLRGNGPASSPDRRSAPWLAHPRGGSAVLSGGAGGGCSQSQTAP